VTLLGVFYNPAGAPIPSPMLASQTAPVSSAAIPEPAAWLLLALGGLIAGRIVACGRA
jgi:hypothetical protein